MNEPPRLCLNPRPPRSLLPPPPLFLKNPPLHLRLTLALLPLRLTLALLPLRLTLALCLFYLGLSELRHSHGCPKSSRPFSRGIFSVGLLPARGRGYRAGAPAMPDSPFSHACYHRSAVLLPCYCHARVLLPVVWASLFSHVRCKLLPCQGAAGGLGFPTLTWKQPSLSYTQGLGLGPHCMWA